MLALRLLRVLLHLLQGLATCAILFPFIEPVAQQGHVKRWSRKLLAICGVTLHVQESSVPPARRALIVANHVSWIDVFAINSLHPCRFVAKSDIRDWPLIGWLCERTGTIFISRGKLREVRRIYENLVKSLHAGEHVAFFPEGTTAAQGGLLPFHANLFEAAIEAGVPVQPYAVRYVDSRGRLHPAANFIGDMTFVQSMVTILKAGGMTAELTVLPVIDTAAGMHRRDLAEAAHQAIAEELGYAEPQSLQMEPGR